MNPRGRRGYTGGMRFALAAVLVAGSALPAAARSEAGRPVYRLAETLSDGVYGLMRGHLFSALLPRRLTGKMARAPRRDSYGVFRARLSRTHARAARRAMDARPDGQAATPAAQAEWRRLVRDEEVDALADAFASTLVERYELERFGRDSGAYALDPGNWEPRFLASASVLGSAYLWAAGVDADWDAGPVRVGVRLAPGWRWRMAADGGGRRLAGIELSRRGSPLSLRAEWGSSGPAAERTSLVWERRF